MKLTLIEKRKEAGDATTFVFKPEQKITYQPGQYMFYTLPTENPDNRGVTRYFTISAPPFENHIQITTRINDESSTFKKALIKLEPGAQIEASGPDGDFTVDSDSIGVDDPERNLIFIAGGIGITPFHSILLEYAHRKINLNVKLLYANSSEDIVFKEELESLRKTNPNFNIQYFISPNHINNEAIKQFNNSDLFYVSGPSPFVRVIRDIIKSLGVSKENIKLDFFPGYL